MSSSPAASSAGDMLFGMGSRLLYAATRVALPPLALAHMGLADYGLWSTCFVLVSYVGMAASGFSLVFLRDTARHHQQGDITAIGRLLSTGIAGLAVVALSLLVALWMLMPALLDAFNVAPAQRALASDLWLGAVGVFLADMSLGAFAHVLHAVGRLRQEQKVWIAACLLETALIVAFLAAGWGARGLLAAFAGRYLFSACANAVLARRALPGLRLSWRMFDPSLLRGFMVFGAGMQASGLVATALQSADRLLAAAFIGPQAAAVMDLSSKVPITAASVATSASSVAVSAAARHDAGQRHDAVRGVFDEATRITAASLALLLPLMAAFAPTIMLAWLGPGEAQALAAPLMSWAVIALHAHMLTGPATSVARGQGRMSTDFEYHALRAVGLMACAALWLWCKPALLSTFAMLLALGQVAAAVCFLARTQARLGLSWTAWTHTTLLPSLAAYALAAGLASLPWSPALERSAALHQLIAATLLWLPLSVALLAGWLLTAQERGQLLRRLNSPLRWRRT